MNEPSPAEPDDRRGKRVPGLVLGIVFGCALGIILRNLALVSASSRAL